MTVTAATEVAPSSTPAKTLLETWGKNERMRHIPPVEWITRKLDHDLRRRIEIAASAFDRLESHDALRGAIEHEFTALCRALDRLGDTARHSRAATPHAGSDLHSRVRESVNHAVANVNAVDPNLMGRRYPFQTFERSKAEPLFGALLVVIQAVNRVIAAVRASDPDLDERLLEGLVTLQTPLPQQRLA